MKHSRSKKDCPYNNNYVESLHSLINIEEIYRRGYIEQKRLTISSFNKGNPNTFVIELIIV